MKSILHLILLLTPVFLFGQGSFTPPGPPGPTQKSLQEIWDEIQSLQTEVGGLKEENLLLRQQNDDLHALNSLILRNLGIELPWSFSGVTGRNPAENLSLAFGPDASPAVAYYNVEEGDLIYAAQEGAGWTLTTVDSTGDTGQYPSLDFGPDGHPAIAYYDATSADLKFARFNGSSWDIQVVDSSGDVGTYCSFAFSRGGRPAIAYGDRTNSRIKYALYDGSSWGLQIVESQMAVAMQLRFSPEGSPAIIFLNSSGGIYYAIRDGTFFDPWNVSTVTTAPSNGVTFDFLANGQPIVATRLVFFDPKLHAFTYDGSSWSFEIVDALDGTGLPASLATDAAGNPFIAYIDEANQALKLARYDGSSWSLEQLADYSIFGTTDYYLSLVIDPKGNPAIACSVAFAAQIYYISKRTP